MRIPYLLYSLIKKVIPISCVDIILMDNASRILLLLRANEPGQKEWWFPGGRVFYGELRIDAAKRKIQEECGIPSHLIKSLLELGTYEVIFKKGRSPVASHAITTVFLVTLSDTFEPILDRQSLGSAWLIADEWVKRELNKFVSDLIQDLRKTS